LGYPLEFFYSNNPLYGYWILFAEIVLCGFVPAFILLSKKLRRNNKALWIAVILGTGCALINRWVMVLQIMAVPVMTFDQWAMYFPSWQEIATTILPVAYGIILIAVSYRYLPVFPDEAELNPIEPPAAPQPEAEADEAGPAEEIQQELQPAEA